MTVIYGNVLRAKEGHGRASLQKTIDCVMKMIPFVRTDLPGYQSSTTNKVARTL